MKRTIIIVTLFEGTANIACLGSVMLSLRSSKKHSLPMVEKPRDVIITVLAADPKVPGSIPDAARFSE
jgi:hypothetical protein